MARRQRRKSSNGVWLLVGTILVVAVLGGGFLGKLASVLVVALAIVFWSLIGALAFDVASWFGTKSSRESSKFRATTFVLDVVLWPYRLWHRVFDEPPIRVETIGELLMLTPSEFEEAICTTLRDNGYRDVHRVGGAGDLGVDILCRDPNGYTLGVQCKRYAPGQKVGSRELQLFIGMAKLHHGVERAVYVTTADYTAPARALAEQHQIKLIDGRDLARIIGPAGPALPNARANELAPASTPGDS